MKVEKVGVSLAYSEGGKRVELKAEGAPGDRETWQQALVTLNNQLGLTMKGIWGQLPEDDLLPEEWDVPQAASSLPPDHGQVPRLPPDVPQAASSFPPDHWCEEHRSDWKQRTNRQTGETFYSHQKPDKSWCNQPT